MRVEKIEREINQFKLIMIGENYVKKMKTEEFGIFKSDFFEFIEKIEKEGDFENSLIHDTYKKILKQYKLLISK